MAPQTLELSKDGDNELLRLTSGMSLLQSLFVVIRRLVTKCEIPHWLGGERSTLYKGVETSP